MKDNILVFVYGTLKTGEPNHHVMNETAGRHEKVGAGVTVDCFPLMIASAYNIPFLLCDKGKGKRIHGEVYRIDNEKLVILDELEAYPTLYTREQHQVELLDGSVTSAWIYMMPTWSPRIFESATPLLDNYSSKGDHGREYVEDYVRGKDGVNLDGYNLHDFIKGNTLN